ncbi:uncharacterized protein BXZ73DRAFT_88218 [Epithele typhae]|uniref:uncharacterized protein n=1 Tax=Epithele typhae TaxID=378194 RepID=UPI00200820F3|nr:uncharacterized protein BXZ73DRAFT_88218 [Epithele typhae]KAH9941812.1 hypothetical protein BXZ73DRAFT_88218 [Epithele typhae]
MRLTTLLALLAVPVTVLACEGDCIVGVTNAWLRNYTHPIRIVFSDIANQISDLIPNHPLPTTTFTYLSPILDAYNNQAYHGMETAIFPHYFHGKCLDASGREPNGCPNPNCPIVCGTPGSMVHFFPKLRYIAFNETYHLLQALSTPGTETYDAVERAVLDAADKDPKRAARRGLPPPASWARSLASANPAPGSRRPDIKAGLRNIMQQVHALLEETCGGSGVEATNGLPRCSWEKEMKEYILTFP